jgi:uncharacterized protein YpmB
MVLQCFYTRSYNAVPQKAVIIIIITIIIIIISCHRFSFFLGTSPLEPVVNPTTQASSQLVALSL